MSGSVTITRGIPNSGNSGNSGITITRGIPHRGDRGHGPVILPPGTRLCRCE
jgi:hypothetical protein